MGARAHVLLVSVSLSSLVTTGCIFGGKKKVPQASAASAAALQEPDASLDPRVSAAQRQKGARSLKAERDAGGLAALQKQQRQPQATPAPVTGKDSAVEWPKPEEFALGGPGVSQPDRNAQPARQAPPAPVATQDDAGAVQQGSSYRSSPQAARRSAAVPPLQADDQVTIRDAVAPAEVPPAPAPAAARLQGDGEVVANRPLELPPEAPAAPLEQQQQQPRQSARLAAAQAPAGLDGNNELVKRVAQRLRDNPGDLSAHLDHQLLRFVMDEQVPDLNTLSSLPAEDRELLTALLDGLSNFRSGLRTDSNMLLSKKIRPLLDFAARLKNQAELTIPTIALCRRVSGFGIYEPMDARFVALKQSEAIVYCEVGNVSSTQNEQGVWESRLSQEAVLYTDDGQRVCSTPPQPIVDRSRNRRHDFCVAQKFTLPPNLSINRYILKVTVKDEQAKRMAEAAMPVQVVAVLDPQQNAPLSAAPPVSSAVPPVNAVSPVSGVQPLAEPQPGAVGLDPGFGAAVPAGGRLPADRQPVGRQPSGRRAGPALGNYGQPTQAADTK